ncbi:MAG: serine hydrolase domain-containing protein [Planctomycetota bacterium]|jgi:CubicO group peptidase (beta-lactamase class C family)
MRYFASLIFTGFAALLLADGAAGQTAAGEYNDVPGLPDTPVGQRIAEIVNLLNNPDGEKVRGFVLASFTKEFQAYGSMEDHQRVFADVARTTGGVDFHGIRHYPQRPDSKETVAIVRTRKTQAWRAIVINMDAAKPTLIAGMSFQPARPPSDLPKPGALDQAGVVAELAAYIDMLVKNDAFSGTVLLAKNGTVLFKKSAGEASKRFKVPNKIDTKFNLGSMNKMFTGVAIAQLVEHGKLSFDDPVSKYLSTDWLARDVADKVQVKHLLTHTSGLGGYFGDDFMDSSRLKFRDIDDYKPLMASSTLAFEPGSRWQYSNSGMFLAGVIIEKVSGMGYHEYIRKHVTGPAGMSNTDCYEMDEPVPNLAIGYFPDSSKASGWSNNIYQHVIKGGPAGGGFSTVEDLLNFDTALRANKLVSEEFTETLLSAKPGLNSPNYGFGFGVRPFNDDTIVGHSGGFPGINSTLDMYLKSGFTLAVMSNYDQGASTISEKCRELIGRLKP